MASGVRDGGGQVVEDVAFVGKVGKGTDGAQDLLMHRADPLEQDRDAAVLELPDDLAERSSAGGVEHLQVR